VTNSTRFLAERTSVAADTQVKSIGIQVQAAAACLGQATLVARKGIGRCLRRMESPGSNFDITSASAQLVSEAIAFLGSFGRSGTIVGPLCQNRQSPFNPGPTFAFRCVTPHGATARCKQEAIVSGLDPSRIM
jgi:hypothetical protein